MLSEAATRSTAAAAVELVCLAGSRALDPRRPAYMYTKGGGGLLVSALYQLYFPHRRRRRRRRRRRWWWLWWCRGGHDPSLSANVVSTTTIVPSMSRSMVHKMPAVVVPVTAQTAGLRRQLLCRYYSGEVVGVGARRADARR